MSDETSVSTKKKRAKKKVSKKRAKPAESNGEQLSGVQLAQNIPRMINQLRSVGMPSDQIYARLRAAFREERGDDILRASMPAGCEKLEFPGNTRDWAILMGLFWHDGYLYGYNKARADAGLPPIQK